MMIQYKTKDGCWIDYPMEEMSSVDKDLKRSALDAQGIITRVLSETDGCCSSGEYAERHEYAERTCPVCEQEFCFSCCTDTNVHMGGKYDKDFMICPYCGHDYFISADIS